MKPLKVLGTLLSCVILAGLFTGCAWSIGDGDSKAHSVTQTTKGQELIDLKKAKDQGVISDSEYEVQRKQILAR